MQYLELVTPHRTTGIPQDEQTSCKKFDFYRNNKIRSNSESKNFHA